MSHPPSLNRALRRGGVMIIVLACLAVAGIMMVTLVRFAAVQRTQIQSAAWEEQARWLAISAEERAAARLAANPEYRGETWSVAAEALSGRDGASVKIEVEAIPDQPARRRVSIRADVPDHPDRAHRHVRQVVIETANQGEKP